MDCELNIITPPVFNGFPVKGFFTTKAAGSDRNAVSKAFTLPPHNIYIPVQKHTDKIVIVEHDLDPKIADGVITGRKGILIGVQVADCAPILLYDARKRIAGAVHAGWRGTAAGILRNAVTVMEYRFRSSPADILIALGPGIRRCCYEVGYEVIEAVARATGEGDYWDEKGGKYRIDLPAANAYQAVSSGVPPENIWTSGECTFCLPGKYYSYRFAKGSTGRQGGFIGIV
ncbi:MAG: peptidoglycan editing factor PgeF [Nitrospirae bacterium]|nr:peptidoglycan editing factor PgeF [Nitrospirota bacterium]